MQLIKGWVTLRILEKHKASGEVKKPPRIVSHKGRQDRKVKEFLDYRSMILKWKFKKN